MNLLLVFTFLLILQYGVFTLAENFSFCSQKVEITVLWQPLIMYKALFSGGSKGPVEIHPRDEWLKFFDMLYREFENDDCYDLYLYDPSKQKPVLVNHQ